MLNEHWSVTLPVLQNFRERNNPHVQLRTRIELSVSGKASV